MGERAEGERVRWAEGREDEEFRDQSREGGGDAGGAEAGDEGEEGHGEEDGVFAPCWPLSQGILVLASRFSGSLVRLRSTDPIRSVKVAG